MGWWEPYLHRLPIPHTYCYSKANQHAYAKANPYACSNTHTYTDAHLQSGASFIRFHAGAHRQHLPYG